MCDAFGLSMSMHSNSHLGISLAAMTHLAAATPNLTFACDTHTPWQDGQDVVKPGALRFENGAVPVPTAPGLGVELDRDALSTMNEQYKKCGITARDDTSYMQRFTPSFTATRPPAGNPPLANTPLFTPLLLKDRTPLPHLRPKTETLRTHLWPGTEASRAHL
ncbi:hypothetical protein GCM10020001_071310 [Nonomuraea salmonea]